MKRRTVEFLCDECGKHLPEEFIREDKDGEKYFDNEAYNNLVYCHATPFSTECYYQLDLQEAAAYVNVKKEFCPECRIKKLKEVVEFLERQGK